MNDVCKHGLGLVHDCYICKLEKERDMYKNALEEIVLQQEGSARWETAEEIRDQTLSIARKALN